MPLAQPYRIECVNKRVHSSIPGTISNDMYLLYLSVGLVNPIPEYYCTRRPTRPRTVSQKAFRNHFAANETQWPQSYRPPGHRMLLHSFIIYIARLLTPLFSMGYIQGANGSMVSQSQTPCSVPLHLQLALIPISYHYVRLHFVPSFRC